MNDTKFDIGEKVIVNNPSMKEINGCSGEILFLTKYRDATLYHIRLECGRIVANIEEKMLKCVY